MGPTIGDRTAAFRPKPMQYIDLYMHNNTDIPGNITYTGDNMQENNTGGAGIRSAGTDK
jgi:hypothetical protein